MRHSTGPQPTKHGGPEHNAGRAACLHPPPYTLSAGRHLQLASAVAGGAPLVCRALLKRPAAAWLQQAGCCWGPAHRQAQCTASNNRIMVPGKSSTHSGLSRRLLCSKAPSQAGCRLAV